ncbi:MAG: pilus assembly protein PilM [Candidatus Eremiobacteraeota bacterium]|nr:pilus assembly protein PilM [Candidatus Eremiobacteraeota bacterium]
MFNLFRRPRSLGLDIGSHSLKWALLDRSRKEVVHSGSVALFPERTSLPQTLDWHLWETRVQEVLEEIPEATTVYTVVQGKGTVYGYLEFPDLPEDELKVAAQAEAQQSIPFPADSIQFSYTRVPPLRRGVGVFYAAAVLGEVLRLRQVLERAGRAPNRVEIPPLALAREFQLNHAPASDAFFGLLHLGFSTTHWVVVRDGHPYYARDFAFGMGEFVRALQHGDWAEAERALNEADFRSPALAAPLRKLQQELKRTLAHCTDSLQDVTLPPLLDIYLSGGGARSNLAAVLEDSLRQRVVPDHWLHLKCPQPQAALYKLAAGLAIQ